MSEINFSSDITRDRRTIAAYDPETKPEKNKLGIHQDGMVLQALDADGNVLSTRTVQRAPEPTRIVPQAPLSIAEAIKLVEETGDQIVATRDAYSAHPFLEDRTEERATLATKADVLRAELAKVAAQIAEIDNRVPPAISFRRDIVAAEHNTIGAIRLARQSILNAESEKRFGIPLSKLGRTNSRDLEQQVLNLNQYCGQFSSKLGRVSPDQLTEEQVKARVPSLLQGLENTLLELRTRE